MQIQSKSSSISARLHVDQWYTPTNVPKLMLFGRYFLSHTSPVQSKATSGTQHMQRWGTVTDQIPDQCAIQRCFSWTQFKWWYVLLTALHTCKINSEQDVFPLFLCFSCVRAACRINNWKGKEICCLWWFLLNCSTEAISAKCQNYFILFWMSFLEQIAKTIQVRLRTPFSLRTHHLWGLTCLLCGRNLGRLITLELCPFHYGLLILLSNVWQQVRCLVLTMLPVPWQNGRSYKEQGWNWVQIWVQILVWATGKRSTLMHICPWTDLATSSMVFVSIPGLAAEMYYRDGITAMIGPACTYALSPVARLAAFWNIPIMTGIPMHSRLVSFSCSLRQEMANVDHKCLLCESKSWVPLYKPFQDWETAVSLKAKRTSGLSPEWPIANVGCER